MNLKSAKLAPVLITGTVIALLTVVQALPRFFPNFHAIDRLEWMSYDWRVQHAVDYTSRVATNLGYVAITDDSLRIVNERTEFKWPWPRQLYGKVITELTAQGAKTIGFDILFAEHDKDDPDKRAVRMANGRNVLSDEYFANQMRKCSNVVVAADRGAPPADLFRNNALMMGDISADKDADGVLRRAKPFKDYGIWNQIIVDAVVGSDIDLSQSRVAKDKIILYDHGGRPALDKDSGQPMTIPLDPDGNFDLVPMFYEETELKGRKRKQAPVAFQRVWQMGVILAARELGLDLNKAVVKPGQILLSSTNGVNRVIPLDDKGYFYINWTMKVNDLHLTRANFEQVLFQWTDRQAGKTVVNEWTNRLVMIGSTATGNNVSDTGATSLEPTTHLFTKHWNVASSVITGQFVTRADRGTEWLLMALLSVVGSVLTHRLRPPWPTLSVLAVGLAYLGLAMLVFVQFRYWLPIILPAAGGLLFTHVGTVTYQLVFEQSEKRKIRSVFAKVVSPNVVTELLRQEQLNMGGARRDITVLFADVRGFTTMTDEAQARAERFVKEHNLKGAEAEAHFDLVAQETLSTVNVYLAAIADQIKKHNGTLDKYIGDCVMAFWGAPIHYEQHTVACVKTAIDAQRAMYQLNLQRAEENKRREQENIQRVAEGKPPLDMLVLLSLGTGINSGIAIVGLMGSQEHIFNYTVFGREVNIASRLEGVSGRGRIIIGESTYNGLVQFDPELARSATELPPTKVKGIEKEIRIFEVPWKTAAPAAAPVESPAKPAASPAPASPEPAKS